MKDARTGRHRAPWSECVKPGLAPPLKLKAAAHGKEPCRAGRESAAPGKVSGGRPDLSQFSDDAKRVQSVTLAADMARYAEQMPGVRENDTTPAPVRELTRTARARLSAVLAARDPDRADRER